jgi:hypothetical protein
MNIFVSAFHKIEVDVEYFFQHPGTSLERFCRAMVYWFHKSPSALELADNFLGEIAPEITGAVALADPVIEPEAAAALATAETAIAGVGAALQAANSGASFLTGLINLQNTVPATLQSLDIKNATLKAKIERIATFITSECKVLFPAAENWVKQLEGKTAQAPATSTTAA